MLSRQRRAEIELGLMPKGKIPKLQIAMGKLLAPCVQWMMREPVSEHDLQEQHRDVGRIALAIGAFTLTFSLLGRSPVGEWLMDELGNQSESGMPEPISTLTAPD